MWTKFLDSMSLVRYFDNQHNTSISDKKMKDTLLNVILNRRHIAVDSTYLSTKHKFVYPFQGFCWLEPFSSTSETNPGISKCASPWETKKSLKFGWSNINFLFIWLFQKVCFLPCILTVMGTVEAGTASDQWVTRTESGP